MKRLTALKIVIILSLIAVLSFSYSNGYGNQIITIDSTDLTILEAY